MEVARCACKISDLIFKTNEKREIYKNSPSSQSCRMDCSGISNQDGFVRRLGSE